MILNRHFREFIELLVANGVRFVLVGGYAVGIHGFPRYTGDLDVFVDTSPENAHRLASVFSAFGFGDLGLQAADFTDPDMVIEIGREPLKIQILTGIDGVSFEHCHRNRMELEDAGLQLPFISLDDLLANKAASPRAKDRIDFEELRRIHGKRD